MPFEGLACFLGLLFGALKLLTSLLERGIERTVFAEESIALLLGLIQCLVGFLELVFLFPLLSGQLFGLRRGRRMMSPGMLEPAADRARLVLGQRLTQSDDAFATRCSAALDDAGDRTMPSLGVLELPPGLLALFQQLVPSRFFLLDLLQQPLMMAHGTLVLPPATRELIQVQLALGGLIEGMTACLASLFELGMFPQQLLQRRLPVIVLPAALLMFRLGLLVIGFPLVQLLLPLGLNLFLL